jgi:hypothetical protein
MTVVRPPSSKLLLQRPKNHFLTHRFSLSVALSLGWMCVMVSEERRKTKGRREGRKLRGSGAV